LLKRFLEASGYSVETAGKLAEATAAMERDFFQIMVSDLGLPDGTGCDLMRRLREKYPLKGIAMSGYGMDKDVRESIEAGFSEHLVKPVDIASLEQAIFKLAAEV
jgi:CheY-like chemotaxis protein